MEGINGRNFVTGQLRADTQMPSSLFFEQAIVNVNGTTHNSYYTEEQPLLSEKSLPALADFPIPYLGDACSTSSCDADGSSVQLPIWADSFYDQFVGE